MAKGCQCGKEIWPLHQLVVALSCLHTVSLSNTTSRNTTSTSSSSRRRSGSSRRWNSAPAKRIAPRVFPRYLPRSRAVHLVLATIKHAHLRTSPPHSAPAPTHHFLPFPPSPPPSRTHGPRNGSVQNRHTKQGRNGAALAENRRRPFCVSHTAHSFLSATGTPLVPGLPGLMAAPDCRRAGFHTRHVGRTAHAPATSNKGLGRRHYRGAGVWQGGSNGRVRTLVLLRTRPTLSLRSADTVVWSSPPELPEYDPRRPRGNFVTLLEIPCATIFRYEFDFVCSVFMRIIFRPSNPNSPN